MNKKEKSEYQVQWYREAVKTKRWYKAYHQAMKRCRGKSNEHYICYGAKGIDCPMKPNDFKFLWFRDGAEEMKRPSISRKDHSLSYTIDNCEYMEYDEHMAQNALRYI